MTIRIKQFAMDRSIVAPCIYKTEPHRVTDWGFVVSRDIYAELEEMLGLYSAYNFIPGRHHYRIDAYFDQEKLWILEINAAFVDGWGTALNLARSCNISANVESDYFPTTFSTEDGAYLPELKLFVSELTRRDGIPRKTITCPENLSKLPATTYLYGRNRPADPFNIEPLCQEKLDNKNWLARFSRLWEGQKVCLPIHYEAHKTTWDNVPEDIVLKFVEKDGPASQIARQSVIFGKPKGKARFLRTCYENGDLLAQQRIQPYRHLGYNTQIVILAVGNHVVTGYVQLSDKLVINDNSIHGPILFDK
ncbi:hypothetical protein COY32_05420 [candidate division WWE3 bacterium CG_4_10_14_0_2_um_filter_41_14]|uniref:Uncharacterized protein n=1 Tax=candidate division WWE3 bacterium CG_4_10_14_0_2_um_filter_41_14 TaxID=1975072 RepID=A0A2M7TGQ7_UNCKA|nr:MAG: hypothetical protein COY32_05420 [candidate division WWE3 bacterium CG_4_10_14_0_2_um_filter_41_14]